MLIKTGIRLGETFLGNLSLNRHCADADVAAVSGTEDCESSS